MSDMATPAHTDAGMDEALFTELLKKKIFPVIQLLDSMLQKTDERIKAVEEQCSTNTEILMQMLTTFDDGIKGYKKSELKDLLLQNHQADLDSLSPIYSSIHDGRDMVEDMLESLLGQGDLDDKAGALGQAVSWAKDKYGKFKLAEPPEVSAVSVEGAIPIEGAEGAEETPEEEPTAAKFVKGLKGKLGKGA